MLKKILKNISYIFFVMTAVLVMLELSSQLYVRIFRKDILNQQVKEDYYRMKMVQDWDSRFRISPYFGYVHAIANNYGFLSKQDFPLKRKDNTYVIAIIGGSVASSFGRFIETDSTYKDLLKKNVPALKNKDIQFMNLAVPGYKQPQQFFILSYFIEQIDYVIQLDGWNEAWVSTSHQFPGDFPAFSEFFYSKQIGPKLDVLVNKKILIDFLKDNQVLNKSLAVAIFRNILQDDWLKTSDDLLVNREPFFYKPPKVGQELKEISIAAMVKYLKLEKDLLNSYKKKAHFFIQPSQYNENSKIFTDLEEKLAFSTAENAAVNAWAFQRVRYEATKSGSTDLAMIFRNEPKTVYIDNCCHLNNLGNKIMAEEIFRVVAEHL